MKTPSKTQVKRTIKQGNKLAIQQILFDRWHLADRPMPQLPYKN